MTNIYVWIGRKIALECTVRKSMGLNVFSFKICPRILSVISRIFPNPTAVIINDNIVFDITLWTTGNNIWPFRSKRKIADYTKPIFEMIHNFIPNMRCVA